MGQSADAFVGRTGFVRIFGIRKLRFYAAIVWRGCISDRVFAVAVYTDDMFCDRRNI